MLVDIAIIIFAISALLRGRDSGLLRQLFSTVGFFGGLFIGAALEPHTVTLAHSTLSRSIITLITTLGCALVFLTVGEYIGISLKHKVLLKRVNEYDNLFGARAGNVFDQHLVERSNFSIVAIRRCPNRTQKFPHYRCSEQPFAVSPNRHR
jgi:uncharacterized membrane protein required for colicin V production